MNLEIPRPLGTNPCHTFSQTVWLFPRPNSPYSGSPSTHLVTPYQGRVGKILPVQTGYIFFEQLGP